MEEGADRYAEFDACRKLRAQLRDRSYDVKTIFPDPGDKSVSWTVGDEGRLLVRGWVISLHVEFAAAPSLLATTIAVKQDWKGSGDQSIPAGPRLVYTLPSLTRGGQFYAPWPTVSINLLDVSAPGGCDVYLLADPVLIGDPNPVASTKLYGHSAVLVAPGATAVVTIPEGATGYQATPAEVAAFVIEEQRTLPTPLTWANYTVDSGIPTAPGSFDSRARVVGPDQASVLLVTNNDLANGRTCGFVWEFDLAVTR